jgi:hypothetical protein
MIRFAAVFILGIVIALAQKQPDKKQKSETIPAEATEISSGLFKHTDASGKTWLYRKTPFGIQKNADHPVSAPIVEPVPEKRGNPFNDTKAAASPAPAAKVVEDGDTYKFERSTPFGPVRWTRKKSELTPDEQEIVKAHKNAANGTKE